MSYHVDSKTLLFDDLMKSEATELHHFVSKLVMEGFVNCKHPAFISWMSAAKLDGSKALLVYSTSFPQRALLSVARHLGKALADKTKTHPVCARCDLPTTGQKCVGVINSKGVLEPCTDWSCEGCGPRCCFCVHKRPN